MILVLIKKIVANSYVLSTCNPKYYLRSNAEISRLIDLIKIFTIPNVTACDVAPNLFTKVQMYLPMSSEFGDLILSKHSPKPPSKYFSLSRFSAFPSFDHLIWLTSWDMPESS